MHKIKLTESIHMFNTREQYIENILAYDSVGAELGVFEGEFSHILKSSSKFKKLYLVDIFEGSMVSGDKNGENEKTIDLNPSYMHLLDLYKDDTVVEVVKNTSHNFLTNLPDDYLSFVYIDADHSHTAVKEDLELSLRKVKNGGIIAGHDYSSERFYGVVLAVNEFIEKYKLDIQLTSDDKLASYFIVNNK
jgi:hypothetical protein